ncbi:hypothetical protein [Brachybacterium alimentarium]
MSTEALNAYVTAALNRAPDLTPQKRDELTRHLRPGTRKGRR